MKEVRKEDLPSVHGGAEEAGTVVDTSPYPTPDPAPSGIAGDPLSPPTLPQKHVET
jgi:hypothetical protein